MHLAFQALLTLALALGPSVSGNSLTERLLAVKRLIPEEFARALFLAQIRVVDRGVQEPGSDVREPVEVPEFQSPQPDDPTWVNLQQLFDEVPPTS